jgi:hypothetical protein
MNRTLLAASLLVPLAAAAEPGGAFEEALNDKTPNLYFKSKRTTTGARTDSANQETWINGRRMHMRVEEKDGLRDLYVKSGPEGEIVMVNKGQGMRMDMNSPIFQQMRQSLPVGSVHEGLAKKGTEKIAGRTCDVYEGERTINLPMGAMKTETWVCVWKGVALKSITKAQGSTTEFVAEEIKEGGASDADLAVPASVPVKDFKLPPGFGPPSTRPR